MSMLLIDFTSRAPGAISAIISLDVRPLSAARDLVTPATLMSGLGSMWALVASIRIRPRQSISFKAGHVDPIRREDHHVARGRLLFRSSSSIRAKSGDEITKRLRPARIRNDYLVTSADQMPAECLGHGSGADEADFHRPKSFSDMGFRGLRVDGAVPG
jgi:hypothetical protein